MMQIRKIDSSNKKDISKFIQFPFRLYKNNPYWVPPMVNDVKLALNRGKHPFYQHSQADFFLAEDGNHVLGRIAAIDNEHYKTFSGDKTGFFCFFEVVEELEVAQALFNSVFTWAKARGLRSILGPKGLAQGDGLGLLVEGFEYMPAIGIAYNPEYYANFITAVGFSKKTDYLSGYQTADYSLDKRVWKLAERVKKRSGFWVKQFKTKDEMREWIPKIHTVYNQAFQVVPNFFPITEAEVQLIAERILSIAHPKLIKLIFKGDDLIGFAFSYHNISKGIQKARGRMWPFGWYHLIRDFKRTRWVDFNGIGLLPEYQGSGATAILYTELEKNIREFDFQYGDIVQIAETNMKSFGEMDNLGWHWHKRHRVYVKNL
jgi:hypothetical protein